MGSSAQEPDKIKFSLPFLIFQRDYHSMAWIGFIPASLLTAGCFIFLLYIHEALEQDQEEQNVRRLLTLLAFQTFLCAYLAGANRVS